MQQGGSYQDFLKWGRGVLFTISLLGGISVLKVQRWCGVNTCLTTVLVENFFFFFLKLVHWWRFYVFGQVKILRCYGSTSLIEYLQLRALWTEQEDADSGKKLTLVYKMSCRFGAACYWLKMEDFRDL